MGEVTLYAGLTYRGLLTFDARAGPRPRRHEGNRRPPRPTPETPRKIGSVTPKTAPEIGTGTPETAVEIAPPEIEREV